MINSTITLRIILDIVITIAVFNAWWFVALPVAVIGTFTMDYYAEAFIAGVAYDALFGFVPETGVWAYAGIITSTATLAIVGVLKKIVR